MKLLPKERQELDFKDWATGYAGIVGGNLKGKLWFCGIEYGGNDDEIIFISPEENQQSYNGVPCWDNKEEIFSQIKKARLQYDYKCAKIACLYFGLPIDDYKNYFIDSLFYSNGETFKLNLYPLAFKDRKLERWTKNHILKTGFETKLLYQKWCEENRFPILKSLVKKHQPEILLFTGKTCEKQFVQAFIDNVDDRFLFEVVTLDSSNRKFNFKFYSLGKTLIVVSPHLIGRWGLNSNESTDILAGILREQVNKFNSF